MIQRIQTLYLLLGVVALAAMFFVAPAYTGAAAEAQGWFGPVVFGLAALAALVGLIAIFLFKNRPQQRTMIVAAQVLTVLHLAALFVGLYLAGTLYVQTAEGLDTGRLVMVVLPLVAYVLFFFARRSVDRDIALVKSMDRLR